MKKYFLLTFMAAFTFLSLKAQITTFPHTTDFESEVLCGTSCTGSCNIAGGWKNADQYGFTQAGTDWLVAQGSTPSTATGPDIDHTLGTAAGKYIYMETSGCNNTTAHIVSAIYDFSAVSAPKIKFWYHLYGATMGTMHIDVDSSGLGNWNLDIVPSWTDNLNLWQEKDLSLANYGGKSNVRIRIRSTSGTSFTSDMGLDDITVYQPSPNDIGPISLTAGGGCGNSVTTPVVIGILNSGGDTIFPGTQIPVGFSINSSVVMDTISIVSPIAPGDTLSYTFVNGFADLTGPTIVSITGWTSWTLDSSTGNDSLTTTTMGIPIVSTFPYFENFESGQNGWAISAGSPGTWAFGTPTKAVINSAYSGLNAFVNGGLTGTYVDNENSFVSGPCFDFSSICDPVLSMQVWWNAEFSWDGMNVTYSTDGGVTWQLVGAFGDPISWYTDNTIDGNPGGFQAGWSGRNSTANGSGGWVNVRHRLIGTGNLPNVKIRINFGSDGSVTDDGVAFDDIRIFNGVDLGLDQTICSPDTLILNANNGNPSASYLWSNGNTSTSIVVNSTGWYSIAMNDGGTCNTTDSIYVVVADSLTTINLGPDTTSCATAVMLDASYWPGCSYLWSNGGTSQTILVNTSGTYIANVSSVCGSILADTVVVTVNSLPIVNFSLPFSTLCLSDGPVILSGGSPVGGVYSGNGVNAGSFDPSIAGLGNHSIIYNYTDPNGCSDTSIQTITVDNCTGIQEILGGSSINVFPNPTDGIFTIQLKSFVFDNLSIAITDIQGRIVLEKYYSSIDKSFETKMDLSQLENGIYFLQLNSNNQSKTMKLILNQ